MNFTVIIPARFASTRLLGKPLITIGDKPMIQHVYERAQDSGASAVFVATDCEKVSVAVRDFGGESVMTSSHCRSGTERLSEATKKIGLSDDEIIVNLQGDEPAMSGQCIRQVAHLLQSCASASVSTLCEAIEQPLDVLDPNIVKVVCDQQGFALYFSRAPIPFKRDVEALADDTMPNTYWRHVGLYAYRAGFVHDYVNSAACALEKIESLEQLRVLYHGQRIRVEEACGETGVGVDTPQDLEKIRQILVQ